MVGSFKLDSGITTMLMIVIVLIMGGYLYLEIRKISREVNRLKKRLERDSLQGIEVAPPKPVIQFSETPSKGNVLSQSQSSKVPLEHKLQMNTTLQSLMEAPSEDSLPEKSVEKDKPTVDPGPPISYDTPLDHEINDQDINDHDINDHETEEHPEVDSESIDDIKIITQDKDPYREKTVSELKAILQEKGLPLSGNKTKLINRIKEHVTVEKQ